MLALLIDSVQGSITLMHTCYRVLVKTHLFDLIVLTGDPGGLEIGLQKSYLQQACACHTVALGYSL